jgi:hypothetical protein
MSSNGMNTRQLFSNPNQKHKHDNMNEYIQSLDQKRKSSRHVQETTTTTTTTSDAVMTVANTTKEQNRQRKHSSKTSMIYIYICPTNEVSSTPNPYAIHTTNNHFTLSYTFDHISHRPNSPFPATSPFKNSPSPPNPEPNGSFIP